MPGTAQAVTEKTEEIRATEEKLVSSVVETVPKARDSARGGR